MRTARILAGLGAALAAVAGTGGVAVATPNPAPADAATGGGAPAATAAVHVVDDTGTIALDVPVDWTVETAPRYFVGVWGQAAGLYPSIRATPPDADPAVFGSEVIAQAVPLMTHSDLLESTYGDYGIGCDTSTWSESPFDNGVLVGTRRDIPGPCHDMSRHTVVGDHGASFTVIVDGFARSPADDAAVTSMVPTIDALSDAPITGPVAPGDAFPWDSFRSVPRLGTEPVRGSGCGADGSIGDTIPDGVWAALTSHVPDGDQGTLELDLLCVFTPDAATGIVDEGTAHVVNDDPAYLVVNNNPRTRTVGTVADLAAHQYDFVAGPDGTCSLSFLDESRDRSNVQAWVIISGGVVTQMFWDCAPLQVAGSDSPSGNLPPATAGGDVSSFWPYGEFWNVPQLGTEPVRGSGCGGAGQIGDRIPDGLWAGYVSVDAAAPGDVWVDLLCIYFGESAQAVRDAGTANIVHDEPDYLIVDNSDQDRVLANSITAIAASAPDASGRCVPTGLMRAPQGQHLPGAGDWFGTDPAQFQAWVRVHEGAVTWLVYGCDTGFSPGG